MKLFRNMTRARLAGIGAAASVALLAGSAIAQTRIVSQGRVIDVPPGAVVLVVPSGSTQIVQAPGVARELAFPVMPDPDAILAHMQAVMAEAQREMAMPPWMAPDRTIPAAFQSGRIGPGVSGVFVSSVSNGSTSCTRQVTYDGAGAPKVQVFGNGCGAAAGSTVAQPETAIPERPAARTLEIRQRAIPSQPRLIEAANHSHSRPLQLAQLRD